MKLSYFTTAITVFRLVSSENFTWSRSKRHTDDLDKPRRINYSYREFVEEAEKWSNSINTSVNVEETRCEIYMFQDNKRIRDNEDYERLREIAKSNKCYKIEVAAPGRDQIYEVEEGHYVEVGHPNEASLYNLLRYSSNDEKAIDYWFEGIDKAKLMMKTKLKCEKVFLPIENLGMTMATEGKFAFSDIVETSVDKAWKVGTKLDVKSAPISPTGNIIVSVNGFYRSGHKRSLRTAKRTTYHAFPHSPCTPSLIKTALWCPPIKAWRVLTLNNYTRSPEPVDIPGQFIQNISGNLFPSFTACIDYTRD